MPSRSDRPWMTAPALSESAGAYLEQIDALIQAKGFARVSDVASGLQVARPSVTAMVKRLAEQGWLEREHYRGFRLSRRGEKACAELRQHHETLLAFLEKLGVPEVARRRDAGLCAHLLSPETLAVIERWVRR